MKTLKLIVMTLAVVFMTTMTYAQETTDDFPGPKPTKERAEQRFERFATRANLTAQQKAEMKDLFDEHWQVANAKREQHREEMNQIRLDFEAKIGKVLTDEQMATFKELRKNKPRQGKGQRGRRMRGC